MNNNIFLSSEAILDIYRKNDPNINNIIKTVDIRDMRYTKLKDSIFDDPRLFNLFISYNNESIERWIDNQISISSWKFLDNYENCVWFIKKNPELVYDLLLDRYAEESSDSTKLKLIHGFAHIYELINNGDDIISIKPFKIEDLSKIKSHNKLIIDKVNEIKTPKKSIYDLIEPINRISKSFEEWIHNFNQLYNRDILLRFEKKLNLEFDFYQQEFIQRYTLEIDKKLLFFVSKIFHAQTTTLSKYTIINIPFGMDNNRNTLFLSRYIYRSMLLKHDFKIMNLSRFSYSTCNHKKICFQPMYDIEELIPIIEDQYIRDSGKNIYEMRALIEALNLTDVEEFLPNASNQVMNIKDVTLMDQKL